MQTLFSFLKYLYGVAVFSTNFSLSFCQEDLEDDDSPARGTTPITSQPSPGKQPNTTVYAMPAPASSMSENAALNQGDVPVYTPGMDKLTFYFSMTSLF